MSGMHSVSSELVSLPEELEAPEPSLAASLARFEQALQKNMRAEDARSERLVNTLVGALWPPATEQQVTITGVMTKARWRGLIGGSRHSCNPQGQVRRHQENIRLVRPPCQCPHWCRPEFGRIHRVGNHRGGKCAPGSGR